MCELLGLAFNKPVSPGLSFRGFRHRGESNPHGWGLAAISPGKTRIYKEPINAEQSTVAEELPDRDPLHAPLFIGHVRRASEGEVNFDNTHPFARPLGNRTLVFAHNGTLDMSRLTRRVAATFTPAGQTDSELAFGALITWAEHEQGASRRAAVTSGHTVDPLADHAALEDFLRDLNDLGTLNLIFSDGRRLFCYHDESGSNGLAFTRRQAPFSHVSLRDEDWQADLGEEKSPEQHGYVIASRPLTDGEEWRPCRPGRLLVIEQGRAVFGA